MTRGLKKATRTLLQLIVSGGLTATVTAITGTSKNALFILAVWQVIVTFAQNTLEDTGSIPTLLPTTPKEN